MIRHEVTDAETGRVQSDLEKLNLLENYSEIPEIKAFELDFILAHIWLFRGDWIW